MRLARVISANDQRNPSVDQLVETASLDVLQLDYVWPHTCPTSPRYAVGLLHQLRTLHKTLFLDPKLHLITNAGGGDPRGCVEAVAEYLCEHGDARLPLTAIRGDNVLPCLKEFVAEGIELRDIATGTTLEEMTQPLLAAQVELGAGPLATALAEGSRFVVAGCYDLAAPMIATAVSTLQWTWEQTDELAQLAVAAYLPQAVVDMDPRGGLTIRTQPGTEINAQLLRQRLLETTDDNGYLRHADVRCQVSDFEFQQKMPDAYYVAGIQGLATSGEWLLRISYQDGYYAEALFACRDTEAEKNTASMLRAVLDIGQKEHRCVKIDLLTTNESDAPTLIRVLCQSPKSEPCEAFVREVVNFSVQSRVPGCPLVGSFPSGQPKISQLCCPVPRDAIGVSVDTRPAKEWR